MSSNCYLRNGTKARRALPCDNDALARGNNTACCDPDDQCLTNGLCRNPDFDKEGITNYVWFFGCTDLTFQDPVCGNYCDKVNTANAHLIWQCDPAKDTWCCHTGPPGDNIDRDGKQNTTCCNISSLVFTAKGIAYQTATVPPSGKPFGVSTLTTPPLLSSTISSILLGSASQSITPASSPPASTSAAAQSTPNAVAIGLGTGLGGGAALALAAGWFIWRRKKRAKAEALEKTPSNELGGQDRNEIAGQDLNETGARERFEIQDKERFEIQDKDPPTEVVGDMYRAELPGSTERAADPER